MARQFVWTPPRDEPLLLTDPAGGYRVLEGGTRGLSSPPYRMVTEAYAGQAGTDLRAMQADQREFALGLKVEARTPGEFRPRWRRLVRALRPLAGDGTLTVTDEWGQVRSIACRYVGGLEGEPGESNGLTAIVVARFVAFDPWWYGPEQTIDVGLAAPSSFFPIFPVTLSTSSVQGEFTVDLAEADTESYPSWTVTGPGSALTLTNRTTGRSIEIGADLGDGEGMVIDTRPGRQSVRRLVPESFELVEVRRNLAGNPRAVTAAGWSHTVTGGAGTGSLLTGITGHPLGISTAYRMTLTAVPTGRIALSYGDAGDGMTLPVAAGQTVSVLVTARSPRGNIKATSARLAFLDAAGAEIGTVSQTASQFPGANVWGTWTHTATAPAGAVRARVDVSTSTASGWTVGDTFDMTAVLVEVAPEVGAYFDGDVPAAEPLSNAWTGAANASPSVQYRPEPSASTVVGENLMDTLTSDPALWPLVEGVNEVSALLTGAGPKSRIRGTYQLRYAGL